ncbi:MAG TPA: cation:dicarboxylase symporter family transporter [Candidatus Thermoplasmatota archaeon]|nr:cation:dicarboxylase symporter family transporter [Candidatus Thermoplasmatota archaeon]
MEKAAPPSDRTQAAPWVGSLLFLGILAAVLVLFFGAYWAPLLLLVEVVRRPLFPVWGQLNLGVDALRARIAPLKKFPGAIVGIPLLFIGLGLGIYAPGTVQWLGDGVNTVVSFIATSAPYIIFFTLTPAIAGTLGSGRAGKFALWVNASYVVATMAAGLLAIIMVVPIFGVRLTGTTSSATTGGAEKMLELAFTSAPFLAIFLAVGLGLMIYGFRLSGLLEATQFVGGKLIDLLGDILKIALPLILFSLGVFIPTRIGRGLARAREAGETTGQGWIGGLSPEAAYFAAIGALVLVLAVWVAIEAVGVMRYTKFPLKRFFKEYFLDVYSYAWATASSSATIPINLERTGAVLGVRSSISKFVIPLGATVHLDGTIIGGMVTAVVAAQLVGYTPTVLDMLYILIPLTIITVGVPGIPGGLAAVGGPIMAQLLPLPPGTQAAFTAIFIGFNIGLSDQFRTGVNSIGNGVICRLFEYWYPTKFAKEGIVQAPPRPEKRIARRPQDFLPSPEIT